MGERYWGKNNQWKQTEMSGDLVSSGGLQQFLYFWHKEGSYKTAYDVKFR